MGKFWTYVKQQWKQVRGNAKWGLLGTVWKWLLPYVPAGATAMTGVLTYLWTQYDQLPGSFAFVLCLGAIAFVLTILGKIRSRPSQKQKQERKEPTLWEIVERTILFISTIKSYENKVSIKIVSTKEGQSMARILVDAFQLANYEVMINDKNTEYFFSANITHDKIIIRYPDENDPTLPKDLSHNLIQLNNLTRSLICQEIIHCLRDFMRVDSCQPFPNSSNINYLQIEVRGGL